MKNYFSKSMIIKDNKENKNWIFTNFKNYFNENNIKMRLKINIKMRLKISNKEKYWLKSKNFNLTMKKMGIKSLN